MTNQERQPIQQTPKPEIAPKTSIELTERSAEKAPEKFPAELRQERLNQIDSKLESLCQKAKSPEETQRFQEQKEQEFQAIKQRLEEGFGRKLGEESSKMIHQKMVEDVLEQAQRENKKYSQLLKEKSVAEQEISLADQFPDVKLKDIRDAAEIIVDKKKLMQDFRKLAEQLGMEEGKNYALMTFPGIRFNEEGNLIDRDKLQSIGLFFERKRYDDIIKSYSKQGATISYGQGRRPLIGERGSKSFFNSAPFYTSEKDPDLKIVKFWDQEFVEQTGEKMPSLEKAQEWYEAHHVLAGQGKYADVIQEADNLISQVERGEKKDIQPWHLQELRGKLIHLQERMRLDPKKIPLRHHKSEYCFRISKEEGLVRVGKDFQPLKEEEQKLPENQSERPDPASTSPSVQNLNEVIYADLVYFPMNTSLKEMNLPKELEQRCKELLPEGDIAPEYEGLQKLLKGFSIPKEAS